MLPSASSSTSLPRDGATSYPYQWRMLLKAGLLLLALVGVGVTLTADLLLRKAPPADRLDTLSSPALATSSGLGSSPAAPAFMVLRYDQSNLRIGPGYEFPVDWVYRQRVPMRVLRVYREWVMVEDFEGVRGWLHRRLLQDGYTAQVVRNDTPLTTYARHNLSAAGAYALLGRGVVVDIQSCAEDFCDIRVNARDGRLVQGWVMRSSLWGSIPKTTIRR